MEQYINKAAVVAVIEKLKGKISESSSYRNGWQHALRMLELSLNTLEVKEVDLEKEIDNNNPKITIGTKIRSKANPYVILSIISDDCHEDKFECSNGTVLSLKQIEKYYDII